jgi:glyoxylase-like metal-dependent hydrolase (beta-lactamase superfamily II)
MRMNDLEIVAIFDGVGVAPPTRVFDHAEQRGSREEDWREHADLLTAHGLLEIPTGSVLIRSPQRTILVDLGIGFVPRTEPPRLFNWFAGSLLRNLALHGVTPSQVTDVVFTHLHFDHVGWASNEGRSTFTRATLHCDLREWEYFHPSSGPSPDARVPEKLTPVEGQFEFWDRDGPILPGVDVIAAPGHTPGSNVVVVSAGGEAVWLLGDVVHLPVELVDVTWGQPLEADAQAALASRLFVTGELLSSGALATATHFSRMHFGRLVAQGGGTRWTH